MAFKHDSTGVNPNGGFRLLPENAWYEFKIIDTKEELSQKGNQMVVCECEVINNDQWNGTQVTHFIPFLPPGSKGASISVHFRKCIDEPYGGVDDVTPENWVGKRFRGYVVLDKFVNKKGNQSTKNKISDVEPLVAPTLVPAVEGLDVPF